MAAAVDGPVLDEGVPVSVLVNGAGVGMAAGYLAPSGRDAMAGGIAVVSRRAECANALVDEAVGVDVVHHRVVVTVKDDHRDACGGWPGVRRGAPSHRGQSGREVVGCAVREAGMHAGGDVQVGVSRGHHRGHGAPGGETGHVDPAGIDGAGTPDLAGDPGDEGRLAGTGELIARPEPVPALQGVGGGRLLGVGDDEGVALGQLVHACAGGEVTGALRTAVQHDDQRHGLPRIAGGDVQLVRARAGRVGVREIGEPGPLLISAGSPLRGTWTCTGRPAESARTARWPRAGAADRARGPGRPA